MTHDTGSFEAGYGMIPTCMCTISRSFVLHVFAFTYSSTPHWNSVDLEVGRHLVLIPPHRHRKARCLEVANSSFVCILLGLEAASSFFGGTLFGHHRFVTWRHITWKPQTSNNCSNFLIGAILAQGILLNVGGF